MCYALKDRGHRPQRQQGNVNFLSAEEIARSLGGGTRAGSGWVAKCPAHDDHNPSLSITDYAHGVLFNCLAGCDFRDVRDALVDRHILPPFHPGERRETPRPRPVPTGPSAEELRNLASARQIYDQAFPCLQSTPCERHLRGRGIWSPAKLTPMRYARLTHPDTREKDVPCLVVPRHDTRTGSVVACHRIFLQENGEKYPGKKWSLGVAPDAWAMLHQATDRLLLAEGMETALSASLSIFYDRPAWAKCGPFPLKIDLPDNIRDVLIAADCDEGGGSERKAKVLRKFIRATGRDCEIVVPETDDETVGKDFNDMLLARMEAA